MRSDLRKLTLISLLLILAAGVSAPAGGRCAPAAFQMESSSKQKLKQAGATANLLIARFHQSLDFRIVFDKHFVTEPELRKRAVRFVDQAKLIGQHDETLMERRYVAAMTYLYLLFQYKLLNKDDKLPPDVQQQTQDIMKHFPIRASDGSHSLTDAEIEQYIID